MILTTPPPANPSGRGGGEQDIDVGRVGVQRSPAAAASPTAVAPGPRVPARLLANAADYFERNAEPMRCPESRSPAA